MKGRSTEALDQSNLSAYSIRTTYLESMRSHSNQAVVEGILAIVGIADGSTHTP